MVFRLIPNGGQLGLSACRTSTPFDIPATKPQVTSSRNTMSRRFLVDDIGYVVPGRPQGRAKCLNAVSQTVQINVKPSQKGSDSYCDFFTYQINDIVGFGHLII
jgi:hypothetical protein